MPAQRTPSTAASRAADRNVLDRPATSTETSLHLWISALLRCGLDLQDTTGACGGAVRGTAGRDALWAHPDLIPSADDLEDPAAFVAREELGDPIAELEKAMQAEEQAEKDLDDKTDGEEPGAAPTS